MKKQVMIIGIDFDGTCVTHEYPEIGRDVGAEPVLKELIQEGHKLILWTMRSGKYLEEAVTWFQDRDIPLFGVNKNPEQSTWTDSPKAYCNLYIDDAALGIPLLVSSKESRPYVNWEKVREMLYLVVWSEHVSKRAGV